MAFETSTFNMQVRDHSRQNKTSSFPIGLITAANLAARITDRDNFLNAYEAITNGLIIKSEMTLRKKFNNGVPAEPTASVRSTLTLHWYDTTTLEAGSTEFGCLDLSAVAIIPNSDELYRTEAAGGAGAADLEAFIAAFQDLAASPRGNAVSVYKATKYE